MLVLRPPEASRGITALETQRTQKEQMSSSVKYCIIPFYIITQKYQRLTNDVTIIHYLAKH